MKTRDKFVLKLLAVGLLAATAMVGSSFSQSMSDRQIGSFTLPVEAHWGTLDLKPGSYSFSVQRDMLDTDLITVKQNNQPIGFVVASLFTSTPETTQLSRGALLCADHNGACVISALSMPWSGVYHFYVPRGAKVADVAASTPAETIPVLFAQK
jgi:hypothetical protein